MVCQLPNNIYVQFMKMNISKSFHVGIYLIFKIEKFDLYTLNVILCKNLKPENYPEQKSLD